MEHTSLSAGTLLAARTLIDATSTFSPVSSVADNQAAITRALIPLGIGFDDKASSGDIANGAIICMQWLVSRATEEPLTSDREELLWSLREFLNALQDGPTAQRKTEASDGP